MEHSFISLLYASHFGVCFSESDLSQIKQFVGLPAGEIFKSLSLQAQDQLKQVSWKAKWLSALELAQRHQIKIISFLCEDYPQSFHRLSKPPLTLSYLGKPCWKSRQFVSVVGSRQPMSQTLEWMSGHLPEFLKATQLSVVSGGARGVDQWAHRLSLAVGNSTLCVIPSGLTKVYPDSLRDLLVPLLENEGALISSYALNQEMRKYFFHQRNELIAALGRFCFVAEAGLKSGSLITARQAGELGKNVMTLPFSVWQGKGLGSNRLLQEGAHIVLDERDLIAMAFGSGL